MFASPFAELRGSVRCSSLAHWQADIVNLLFVLIELFSLGVTAETLRANIDWKSAFSKGDGSVWTKFSDRS